MSRIFICYSRVDRPMAERLAGLLRKAYDHVWYDDNLHGGEEWWAEVVKEVVNCHHFIYLMSDDSVESAWCQRELDEAWRLKKHVVPVLVRARTEVPERLQRIQHISMEGGITPENISLLYATLIRQDTQRQGGEDTSKMRAADHRLLDRLWPFINGRYVEILTSQTQGRKVDWEQYSSHMAKYLDLRSKTSSHFYHAPLEEAFETFDDALIRLDGQFGWTYVLREINGRQYMVEPPDADADTYWFERYRKLVNCAIEMWMRHAELVKTIKTTMPDFDLFKDY